MERITKFKNIHRGKRGFIACNGPSLNDIDMSKLQGEIVFALNRGYIKKDLPVTYLVTIDDLIENQFREEMESFECEAKFSHSLRGAYKLQWTHDVPRFSPTIAVPIWQGHSVTNVALQVAFYMGFKEVYIIGMDHFIDYSNTERVGHKFVNKGGDPNHFDPNYFAGETKYNHQNLERVELGYELARKYYEGSNRKLYNASTQTKLSEDIIPRINFEDIEWQ